MKLPCALLTLLTMFLAQPGAIVFASDFRPNEVLVKYKQGVHRTRATMDKIYDSIGVVTVRRFSGEMRGLEQLILNDGAKLDQVIELLEKNPLVEYAQHNHVFHALPIATRKSTESARSLFENAPCILGAGFSDCTAPKPVERPKIAKKPAEVNPPITDPRLGETYGIAKVGALEAWNTTRGSSKMIVAVIDTGIDYNHEDLSFNTWRNPKGAKAGLVGWDFVHNDNLPFDDHSHGTHCAGVIGAVGGNGKGISGVNQRVSIMGIKFLSAEGSGDEAGAIRAIDYAVRNGAKVLSNSWGGRADKDAPNTKALREAIVRAEKKNVLFIAAAGNDSSDNDKEPDFPAGYNTDNMIAVAATDSKDELAYFSNFGKNTVLVAAPGVDILSTIPSDKYKTMSGTSMACPHVAGAAALIWSSNPELSYAEVKARILSSVDELPSLSDKTLTGGRINVERALTEF